MRDSSGKAVVIGSGPNGLAAAIVLAAAGMFVEVFEGEAIPGGAARTLELTLPGFHHDFGSAVHPMAVGSPFFSTLPLSQHGLQWIHSPAPLAHPLDDGTAVVLERDLGRASRAFGTDGRAWLHLFSPIADHWSELASGILQPMLRLPSHPFLLASFGINALRSALSLANQKFRTHRTKALFAGLAAHSCLSLDEPASASFALVLGGLAHAVGWPIPFGGAQSITNALVAHLQTTGGTLTTSTPVEHLNSLAPFDLALCDLNARALSRIADGRFTPAYICALQRFRLGPGVFKIDYALSDPIPWKAPECKRAITVHLGGTMEEIAASEHAARYGTIAERPFVLLAQPTLFDPSRAPAGKHIAWAYCHVPNGSTVDMLSRIESQIERFAPGFRDCVLARHALTPANLEANDRNLMGGDINGGAANLWQLLFRPTLRGYATPDRSIYLCSASTPPGGGVHGMCGYNAAALALRRLRSK